MKLLRLKLTNFRSFYGETEIKFSTDKKKSVTLFIGKNGAGKTTLLNAIYWAFCGETTPRLTLPDSLVHHWAYKEGKRTCSVELWFSADNEGKTQYRILREGRNSSRESELSVWRIVDGGTQTPLPPTFANATLRKFLPPKLIGWFFFDGEAIDKLSLEGHADFRKDIRRAFGFEQVDTLISDLDWIEKRLRTEISQQTKDSELEELNELIQRLDQSIQALGVQRDSKALLAETIEKKLKKCRDELATLPDSKKLIKEIDVETARLQNLRAVKARHLTQKARILGRSSSSLLIVNQAVALSDSLNDKEFSQKLPAPFGDKLVDDILRDKICICGRPVHKSSPEEVCLNQKRDIANTGVLASRVTRFRSFIKSVQMTAEGFHDGWQREVDQISELDTLVGQSEEALKSLSQILKSSNVDRVQELESERLSHEKDLRELRESLGAIKRDIEQAENQRRNKQSELKTKEKSLNLSSGLGEEYRKVALVREYATRALVDQEKVSLEVLKEEMSAVIERYLTKHYSIEINPSNYRIIMRDVLGNQVAHATGEGVLLKYAFIASMIGMSARNSANEIDWLSEPVVAPLCLDAPFTALDEEYKSDVVKIITGRCEQLVLFLNTDSLDQVSAELGPRVGKTYLMKFYASSPEAIDAAKKQSKTAKIGGKVHTFTYTDSERDESKLEELTS